MEKTVILIAFVALLIGFWFGLKAAYKQPLPVLVSEIDNDYHPSTYKDLDQNLVGIGTKVIDTCFSDTFCIHYGNHPGSITWDTFISKHYLRIKRR